MDAVYARPTIISVPGKSAAEVAASALCLIFILFPAINGVFGWITDNGSVSISVTAAMIFKFQIILALAAFIFTACCWLGGISPAKAFFGLPIIMQTSIVAFAGMALASGILVAPQPLHAHMRLFLWINTFLFGCSVATLLVNLQPVWRFRFIFSVLIGFNLYSILLAAFVLTRPDPLTVEWVMKMPGYDNVRYMGYAYAAAAALAIGWLVAPETPSSRTARGFALFSALLFSAALFWSGSRGGIMAIIVAAGIAFCMLPDLRRPLLRFVVPCLIVGGLVSTLHNVPDPHFGVLRFMTGIDDGIKDISPGRFDLWSGALQAIGVNPWLGYGEGQMKFVVPAAGNTYLHPHNIMLQAWLAIGVIFGTAFLALIAFAWIKAKNLSAMNNGFTFPFFLTASTILAHSFIDGSLFFAQPLMIAAAMLALSFWRPAQRFSA